MLRYLACAGTAVLFAAPAQAALQTYDWTFTGGFFQLTYDYPHNNTLQGSFTVNDLNADGKFDKSELQSLSYKGADYATCDGCAISRFSWAPGSAPEFEIERWVYAPTYSSYDGVSTGHIYRSGFKNMITGASYISGGRWTPDVTWAVSAVPEPQTWLMLGAGLLAVGAAARRRKAA